jgi:hypothetical protein
MDQEMEAPIDELEAMFVEEDEELLGDAVRQSSDDPTAC